MDMMRCVPAPGAGHGLKSTASIGLPAAQGGAMASACMCNYGKSLSAAAISVSAGAEPVLLKDDLAAEVLPRAICWGRLPL